MEILGEILKGIGTFALWYFGIGFIIMSLVWPMNDAESPIEMFWKWLKGIVK